MNKKSNPEAWAAWLVWCKEHTVNPKCSTTQKAFWAGWQAAIREVIKMQGEEADVLDGEGMLEGAQASALRKANASLKTKASNPVRLHLRIRKERNYKRAVLGMINDETDHTYGWLVLACTNVDDVCTVLEILMGLGESARDAAERFKWECIRLDIDPDADAILNSGDLKPFQRKT